MAPNTSAIAFYNLSYGEIADHQARNKEGIFANNGAFAVDTGKFTGRSALDKYIVEQEPSAKKIWWGDINRPMKLELYQQLKEEVMFYYKNKVDKVYVYKFNYVYCHLYLLCQLYSDMFSMDFVEHTKMQQKK